MSSFSNLTDVLLFLYDLHVLNWLSPAFCPITRILTDVVTLLYRGVHKFVACPLSPLLTKICNIK
jgi:hypothetical protein